LRGRLRGSNNDGGFVRSPDAEAVLIGNQVDHIGGIDFSMVEKYLDLSLMTLDLAHRGILSSKTCPAATAGVSIGF
jgi:hypothetical protein